MDHENNNYETLINQNIINQIRESSILKMILGESGSQSVRDEFLNGLNGNCKLEESDLRLLDSLRGKYFTYDDDIDETEDMMSRVVNGSTEIFEGAFTYEDIRAILKKMQKSPMFKHLDALQEPKYQGIPSKLKENMKKLQPIQKSLPSASTTNAYEPYDEAPLFINGQPNAAMVKFMKMRREEVARKKNKPKVEKSFEDQFEYIVEDSIDLWFRRHK